MVKNKIKELDKKFIFCFVEDIEIGKLSPVSDYYTKLDDLSINLLISLKWLKWGYFFMNSICHELDSLKNEYRLSDIISKSIQNIGDIKEYRKIITIDDQKIETENDFFKIIDNFYNDKVLGQIFTENTKIHIKLKLNLREYIIVTNVLYPRLLRIECEKII